MAHLGNLHIAHMLALYALTQLVVEVDMVLRANWTRPCPHFSTMFSMIDMPSGRKTPVLAAIGYSVPAEACDWTAMRMSRLS